MKNTTNNLTTIQKVKFIQNQIGIFYKGKSVWDISISEMENILHDLIYNHRLSSTTYGFGSEKPTYIASAIDVLAMIGAVLFENRFNNDDISELYDIINLYDNNHPNLIKVSYN